MRTVNQILIPQDSDAKYPFGSTIQNETETQEGTPIVEEYIGDIIQNLYKVIKLSGITPTGTEDSESTQYQLVEALRKLTNLQNDVEQVLALNTTVWSVPLNLSILPEKYFFFAKADEDYNAGITYTFKGTGVTEYPFLSSGFVSGDELLVIYSTSGVVTYNLTRLNATGKEVSTTMGIPVAFNATNKMWYSEEGKLFSDIPSIYDLETVIRADVGDVTAVINDVFVFGFTALCFCFIPTGNNYFFRQFVLTDFSFSDEVSFIGSSFDTTFNFSPYVYANARNIYITNSMNADDKDYNFSKFNYNFSNSTLTLSSSLDLDDTFDKTTNAAINIGQIYTMVSGVLSSYSLTTGVKTVIGTFPGVAGQLFSFDGDVYFGSGEVAKKWF